MLKTIRLSAYRTWIKAPGCLVLVGVAFALGYWLGQRQESDALTAKSNNLAQVQGSSVEKSSELKEFAENRKKLAAAMAQLRAQGTNGAPSPQALAQFQQQNKALLDRQRQLAQAIFKQQDQRLIPDPPPLQISPNATPQMREFLTPRDELTRSQIDLLNQHRVDDPAARQAAIQQGQQQNAERLQDLRQLAQALAKIKQS